VIHGRFDGLKVCRSHRTVKVESEENKVKVWNFRFSLRVCRVNLKILVDLCVKLVLSTILGYAKRLCISAHIDAEGLSSPGKSEN
jgi:hypothetical protein